MIKIVVLELISIVSFSILYLSYRKLLNNTKVNILKLVLLSTLIAFLNIIGSYDVSLIIKLLISIISLYIAGPLLYNTSFKKASSLTIIYFMLIMIGDIIVMLVISPFNSIGLKYVKSASIIKAIATLLCAVVIYVLLYIKRFRLFLKKIINYNNSKLNMFRNSVYLVIIMIMILFFYIIRYANDYNFTIALLFSISCLSLLIFTVYNIYKNNSLKIINTFLINNERTYESVILNDKTFRHNMIHELNLIKQVGNKKTKEMIDAYIEEHTKNNGKFDKLISVPSGLKGIIYERMVLHDLDEKVICVDNYIKSNIFSNLNPKKVVKLVECFGIMVDNAIEASCETEKPFIYIYLNEDDNTYEIKCVNNFNTFPNLDSFGVDTKTNKENHMGVGIKYMFNKSGLNITAKIRNDIFTCTMIIKK